MKTSAKRAVARKSVKARAVSAPKPSAKRGAKKAASKRPAAKTAAAKTAAAKRKANAAFMKAMTPSAVLAAVIGSTSRPHTKVTKKIWEYIKNNKLQDTALGERPRNVVVRTSLLPESDVTDSDVRSALVSVRNK